MTFKVIKNENKLPSGPKSVINIFVDNKLEAHRYSNRWPERQVYWIEDEKKGVWVQQLRRNDDTK